MLFLSVGLVVLAVLLLRRRLPGVASAATLASLVLALLLASTFWFISDLLTGRGIDESVLYHLRTDLTGAAFSDFLGPIALGIVLVGVSVGLAFLVYREARTPVVAVHGRVPQIAALTSLIAACYFNPAVTDMRAMYAEEIPDPVANAQTSSAAQKALARIRFPARKKNLVVLYLESFERTLLDPKLFPGLAPHLAALEEQGLSFSNIGQFYGDGWTIAGMVSSQCGVPLALPTDQGNAMSGMNTFLPGATCLGDILRFSGYQMEFMGGADLDFAGKGSFYRTHGFARVEGWNELKSRLRDPRYQHQWGLHDDTLIDLLKNRFDKLASGTQPFGLFALTVNTHHPKGIVAAPCIDVRYEDGRDPVLNAMHCADRMVHEFVTYLQKHPAYEDTVIVLASDHLALPNTASHRLEQGNRKNLLLVLAKDLAPRRVETPGALFDVAPTLLGVLGAEGGGALGYGRDLLGAKPSLAGSMADLKAYLRSRRREDNRLWQFPQLTRGMKVDARKALIALDGSSVRAPALLLLDSALGVQEIKFQHRRWKLIDRVAALPFA